MSKEKRVKEARLKALSQIIKDETQSLRLFAKLRARIHEATPESIREAADLEYELTGDMVSTTLMGEALGLSEFFDCDCSMYYESIEGTPEIKAVGHLLKCEHYVSEV